MRKSIKLIGILALVLLLMFTWACGMNDDKDDEKEEKKVEYIAHSPLGIAESYIGKDVNGLIAEIGTLKGEPEIKPTNDGGGYEGLYIFDGFTAYTYAKSPNATAIVTEIRPDEESDVYKESLKQQKENTK